MILHPGAHVGAGTDVGIKQVFKSQRSAPKIRSFVSHLRLCMEKALELGRNFEELARIYDGVTLQREALVCFDAPTHDSGYDIIHDFDRCDREI